MAPIAEQGNERDQGAGGVASPGAALAGPAPAPREATPAKRGKPARLRPEAGGPRRPSRPAPRPPAAPMSAPAADESDRPAAVARPASARRRGRPGAVAVRRHPRLEKRPQDSARGSGAPRYDLAARRGARRSRWRRAATPRGGRSPSASSSGRSASPRHDRGASSSRATRARSPPASCRTGDRGPRSSRPLQARVPPRAAPRRCSPGSPASPRRSGSSRTRSSGGRGRRISAAVRRTLFGGVDPRASWSAPRRAARALLTVDERLAPGAAGAHRPARRSGRRSGGCACSPRRAGRTRRSPTGGGCATAAS